MGKNSRGDTETVERFLDSTLESVDSAEELALQEAERAGVPEDDLHKIAMAVRESMVNAVVHGNRYNAHKKVHLTLTKGHGEFVVRITDQGEGFDYENLPDPLAEENLLRHSGRGIFLIKAFMDDFRVRRLQPEGTEVTLVKYLVSK
ncbi:MAG TPA: ATP-binding protein [Bryobacteraceae bacterium]|nr:ATP-binding protein [Bryobacteraceae bacterium]